MAKIIFLDFDGVLNTLNSRNSDPSMKSWPDWGRTMIDGTWVPLLGIDKLLVAKLNGLVSAGADIVVSSTWRTENTVTQIRMRLVSAGMDPRIDVIGYTPVLPHRISQTAMEVRAEEIREWLKEFGEDVTDYVVLDDSQYAKIEGHFVQTDPRNGLTDADVAKAISILSGATP